MFALIGCLPPPLAPCEGLDGEATCATPRDCDAAAIDVGWAEVPLLDASGLSAASSSVVGTQPKMILHASAVPDTSTGGDALLGARFDVSAGESLAWLVLDTPDGEDARPPAWAPFGDGLAWIKAATTAGDASLQFGVLGDDTLDAELQGSAAVALAYADEVATRLVACTEEGAAEVVFATGDRASWTLSTTQRQGLAGDTCVLDPSTGDPLFGRMGGAEWTRWDPVRDAVEPVSLPAAQAIVADRRGSFSAFALSALDESFSLGTGLEDLHTLESPLLARSVDVTAVSEERVIAVAVDTAGEAWIVEFNRIDDALRLGCLTSGRPAVERALVEGVDAATYWIAVQDGDTFAWTTVAF